MPDIKITLNKYESIQFNQLKTQSVSSIFNLEDKPITINLSKMGSSYHLSCTCGNAYIQAFVTRVTLWKDSTLIKTIVEVLNNGRN